jgi:excisionase family DNA binding protein
MSEEKAPEAPADYLTAEDVAARVKVSPPTIYRWSLDDPSMPTLRIGRTVRFPRERLERWLRGREQGRRGRA